MSFMEIIAVYTQNHIKHIQKFVRRIHKPVKFQVLCECSNHYVLFPFLVMASNRVSDS